MKRRQYSRLVHVAYNNAVFHAKTRDIPFRFSVDEWVGWWQDQLGDEWFELRRWHKGKPRGPCYVMARKRDQGPYEAGNVICITHAENSQQVNGSSM
jgi:hypothetical protein